MALALIAIALLLRAWDGRFIAPQANQSRQNVSAAMERKKPITPSAGEMIPLLHPYLERTPP